jgi:hypothetical protein
MKHLRILCLWIASFAWLASASAQSITPVTQNIIEYGQECKQKVSDIPAFNCMNGELVPITVNGGTPAAYTPGMTCDKPAMLPSVLAEQTDGQCVPNSRALVLRDDSQAQISAFCRQKKIRAADQAHMFDEVDIIAHNVRTGSTCWFQAAMPSPLQADKGIDGRAIPSATQATYIPPGPNPLTYWNSPSKTANLNCVSCHDSGPFMYSPFIAQTKALPGNPFGKYKNDVGVAFKAWPQPYGITTRGNTCTACHRIGNMNSIQTATFQASGMQPYPGQDALAQQFPLSHWMAPGNLHSQLQWNQEFIKSINALVTCYNAPQTAGCLKVDYNHYNQTSPLGAAGKSAKAKPGG